MNSLFLPLKVQAEMAPLVRTPSVRPWFQLWATNFAGEWRKRWIELRQSWTLWNEPRRTWRKDIRSWRRWFRDLTKKWWEILSFATLNPLSTVIYHYTSLLFSPGWSWQEHRPAEEKGRGIKRGFGENGEPVREQRHWRRHCAHSSFVQADPEPVRRGERNWGHNLLSGRSSPQRCHRSRSFPQGTLVLFTQFTVVCDGLFLTCIFFLFQHVRLLSRKQFQLRALMQKARKTAGLSDLYWPTLTTLKQAYLQTLTLLPAVYSLFTVFMYINQLAFLKNRNKDKKHFWRIVKCLDVALFIPNTTQMWNYYFSTPIFYKNSTTFVNQVVWLT